MRISPINLNVNKYRSQNFKGIHSIEKDVPTQVLGDKLPIYEKVSDEKSVDIWLFKKVIGGMAKLDDGYIALIQDNKNSSLMKSIECSGGKEEIEKFKNRLENSLVWVNADSNMFTSAALLQDTNTTMSNPEFAKKMCAKLDSTGNTNLASGWKTKFENS